MPTKSIDNRKASVTDLQFSNDGKVLIAATNDGRIIIWDKSQNNPIQVRHFSKRPNSDEKLMYSVKSNYANSIIASAGGDGYVRFWSFDGRPVGEWKLPKNYNNDDVPLLVNFSKTSNLITVITKDRLIYLIELVTKPTLGSSNQRAVKGHHVHMELKVIRKHLLEKCSSCSLDETPYLHSGLGDDKDNYILIRSNNGLEMASIPSNTSLNSKFESKPFLNIYPLQLNNIKSISHHDDFYAVITSSDRNRVQLFKFNSYLQHDEFDGVESINLSDDNSEAFAIILNKHNGRASIVNKRGIPIYGDLSRQYKDCLGSKNVVSAKFSLVDRQIFSATKDAIYRHGLNGELVGNCFKPKVINDISIIQPGRYVKPNQAIIEILAIASSKENRIELWPSNGGNDFISNDIKLNGKKVIKFLQFSPNGRYLVAHDSSSLGVWRIDFDNGNKIAPIEMKFVNNDFKFGIILDVSINDDGRVFIVGSNTGDQSQTKGRISEWFVDESSNEIKLRSIRKGDVRAVSFNYNKTYKYLYAIVEKNGLVIYDQSDNVVANYDLSGIDDRKFLSFSINSRYIYIVDNKNKYKLFEVLSLNDLINKSRSHLKYYLLFNQSSSRSNQPPCQLNKCF